MEFSRVNGTVLRKYDAAKISLGVYFAAQIGTLDHQNRHIALGTHILGQLFQGYKMRGGIGELNAPGLLQIAVNVFLLDKVFHELQRWIGFAEYRICRDRPKIIYQRFPGQAGMGAKHAAISRRCSVTGHACIHNHNFGTPIMRRDGCGKTGVSGANDQDIGVLRQHIRRVRRR